MEDLIINNSFITKWHPQYEATENDQNEYEELIRMVKSELNKGISRNTFERIINWKSPRIKGHIKWEKYKDYEISLKKAISDVDIKSKIIILSAMHGIGIPTASTILHFIYPKKIPIVDIRTVETLMMGKYLCSNKGLEYYRNTVKGYEYFCQIIDGISKVCSNFTLREIDRALFAYHKNLNKDIKEKKIYCKKY